MAEDVEFEQSEDGTHRDALQAVGAAGEPGRLVRDLGEDERDAERHHEAREIGAAQDEKARDEAERCRREAARDEPEERIARDVLREEPRRIGTEAEKGGMAERNDAGIAEDEIEGDREQADDGDLVENEMAFREEKERCRGGEPEQDLGNAPAPGAAEAAGDGVCGEDEGPCSPRASRKALAGAGRGRRSSACR